MLILEKQARTSNYLIKFFKYSICFKKIKNTDFKIEIVIKLVKFHQFNQIEYNNNNVNEKNE